jgi:LexA-binding, inner membrane-associated putative hydrolase
LDLLWPIFLLLNLEVVRPAPGITKFTPLDFVRYPWTHSLLCVVGWAVLFGGIYFAVTRYGRGAFIVGLLVVSHWALDWLTHRPDLPLYPGGPKVGLGLWNSVGGTLALELLLFIAGAVVYLRNTRAKDKVGEWALWAFLGFLIFIYLISSFSPTVPQPKQIAWASLTMWLFVPWAYWIERHRVTLAKR